MGERLGWTAAERERELERYREEVADSRRFRARAGAAVSAAAATTAGKPEVPGRAPSAIS
jgi:hypothetical protein